MTINRSDLRVARVVNNSDPEFITIEVAKRTDVQFTIQEGDEFLTLVWVKRSERSGEPIAWDPFDGRPS